RIGERGKLAVKPHTCPRCDAHQVLKIADSPIKGKWEAYRCESCNFVWRSTEDLTEIAKLSQSLKDSVQHLYPGVPEAHA
ncbi:MAG: non-oxidative hydroxyarylic acid decarboxylases subunit D, partial [Dehalococcoidia bacterium]|nr:non-oxidative hydroxyarylic acid decarboxylases subunit D [Dehalococcoidia bacterium]